MSSFHVDIITLHPEIFPGTLAASVIGKAREKGIWSLNTIDLHNFVPNNKTRVDDTPYGGGPGMIIRPDVIGNALDHILEYRSPTPIIIYMSARGKTLTQKTVEKLSQLNNIIILCGRFEGIDQRVIEVYSIKEISIGDYILAGGEVAALALVESCVRLIPGVLGNPVSIENESFTLPKLEHSQYTRPYSWNGAKVPDVLLSGNHRLIKEWQMGDSNRVTNRLYEE